MADDPKLAEFRDKNIALLKEVADLKARYEGIDPDAVKADRAKLAELQTANPRLQTLETELAAEKTAHAETRKRSDAFIIDSTITDAFLKGGGRPETRAFVVAQSAGQFVVENGQVKGTQFSPDRAGEPMSVDEWITLQTRQHAFCFLPSTGSGASASRVRTSTAKVLKNPSPADLGRFGKEIANGNMRVEYDE
jgi:hypothetical protein